MALVKLRKSAPIVLVMYSTMLDVPHISWGRWLFDDATKASYFRGYDGYDINGVYYG
jgi:hypothetical protein